jgi:hypothetical protein
MSPIGYKKELGVNNPSNVEIADRLSRRRARMMPMFAIIFLTQQFSYLSGRVEEGTRTVDHVRIAAWLVLSIVLLLALTTGGFWRRSKEVRALLDDDVTRANRVDALRVGFLATMAAGIVLYFITLFEAMGARDAIHILMSVGIVTALLRFAYLERRAHRDG